MLSQQQITRVKFLANGKIAHIPLEEPDIVQIRPLCLFIGDGVSILSEYPLRSCQSLF